MLHRKLKRRTEHRLSMLRNMSIDLIKHGKLVTTIGRAKELKSFVEKLVTKAKTENLARRRLLLSRLHNNNEIVSKLFEIGKKMIDRPGGYTSLIRAGIRRDGSKTAHISFVE